MVGTIAPFVLGTYLGLAVLFTGLTLWILYELYHQGINNRQEPSELLGWDAADEFYAAAEDVGERIAPSVVLISIIIVQYLLVGKALSSGEAAAIRYADNGWVVVPVFELLIGMVLYWQLEPLLLLAGDSLLTRFTRTGSSPGTDTS